MRVYKYLFILLFSGSFQTAFSQTEISGRVVDSTKNPIVYANVVLLAEADSTAIAGTISSGEGKFLLALPEKKNYLLKVSFVGYATVLRKINASEFSGPFEIIMTENASELGEVVLNAARPRIVRKADRLIFNIENTSLSSDNTWGILEKTPGVISIQGTLNVRNAPATIYLNGRKVHLPMDDLKTLLESYAGENIQQIEVIPNPPASFDAESGPVLNIVTTTNLIPGYKGSIYGDYTQAIFPKYSLGTSHFYKTEKLNLFLNYGYNPGKEFKTEESYINFMDDAHAFSKWRSDFDKTTRFSTHTINAILDYYFDERNSLNFQALTLLSPNKSFDNHAVTRIFDPSNELDSLYTTESYLENDLQNIAVDLGYEHQFKKEGTQLSAVFHYTDYDQTQDQWVATHYFDPEGNNLNFNEFITKADQATQIYSGKLDFQTGLGKIDFMGGLKISNVDSESSLDFFDAESGSPVFNTTLSDLFLYDETVYAGYVDFSKKWNKWSAKIGLRGEQTERSGKSVSTGTTNDRNYFEWFPSAYISYKASENHQFSFDYGRKIERPNYEALNPFKYFINENNFKSGNPNLEASISNNFNLNYTYKNAYFFDLYYRDNGDNAAALVFQDNEALTLHSVQMNVEDSKSYGLDFLHRRSITKKWYGQLYMSLFHEEETFSAIESDFSLFTNEIDAFYVSLYNSLDLSKDGTFSGDTSLYYLSNFIEGSYQMENIFNLSFGLRKELWKGRAEISLKVADIFNTTAVQLYSQYYNQDNGFFSHPENRYVKIGMKFNFGNSNLSDNERSSSTEERKRL